MKTMETAQDVYDNEFAIHISNGIDYSGAAELADRAVLEWSQPYELPADPDDEVWYQEA